MSDIATAARFAGLVAYADECERNGDFDEAIAARGAALNVSVEAKTCRVCNVEKPLCEFRRRDNGVARRTECRSCQSVARRERKASPGLGEVPIGPFRAWLEQRRERHETFRSFADDLDAHEREVYRWLYESSYVRVLTLDRVLTAAGEPWLLEEFCPAGRWEAAA